LGFQYPIEVPGVNFANFLRMAANENKTKNEKFSPIAFRNLVKEKAAKLVFSEDITKRFLNEGFSGGEKKKAEILQMTLLKPSFAILDEPDSGLDVDALKYISKTIMNLDFPVGLVVITHYQRILHYLKPDFVHVLINGKIIKSGGADLAEAIEKNGYEKIFNKK
jgi:Fe-S cluster assembly ATP-binding protein